MLAYGIIIYRQAEPYFTGYETEIVTVLLQGVFPGIAGIRETVDTREK
jgi:hypothetical protein